MPTKQLYLYDSYLKEFDAKVLQARGRELILDQTAFHPISGGVSYDMGTIIYEGEKHKVLKVELDKETGNIVHFLEDYAEINPGNMVKGVIDWNRRYRLMRLHTAAHLIAAVMYREYNALITGGNVDYEYAKLDFNIPVTSREIFLEAVKRANEAVKRRIPVKIYFLTRREALKIPGIVKLAERMPPEEKNLRIVEIEGVDIQADGGPHVKNTGEIGEIKLIKVQNKGKNRRRIYFNVM
ncbi:MAG: alanyl-tRNA editing protein AlaXM [archaeon GB-1867-097]|nr:alanyl-tRNA editing protein AlaXM [Candidatus Culexmicrobium thermophilum]MCS7384140.1 alanyl-tRNA editing protein AlaXM [Candidatus Culexmicrobium thermophilum]